MSTSDSTAVIAVSSTSSFSSPASSASIPNTSILPPVKTPAAAIDDTIDNRQWWTNLLYLLSYIIGFAGFALASEVGKLVPVFFAPLIVISFFRLALEFKHEDKTHRYLRRIATALTSVACALLILFYAVFSESVLLSYLVPASFLVSLVIEFFPAVIAAWKDNWRNKLAFSTFISIALAVLTIALIPNLAASLLSIAKLSDTLVPFSFLGAAIFFAVSIILKNTQENLVIKEKQIQESPLKEEPDLEQILGKLEAVATSEPPLFAWPAETIAYFETIDKLPRQALVETLSVEKAHTIINNIGNCKIEIHDKISREAQSIYNEEVKAANELKQKAETCISLPSNHQLITQTQIQQKYDKALAQARNKKQSAIDRIDKLVLEKTASAYRIANEVIQGAEKEKKRIAVFARDEEKKRLETSGETRLIGQVRQYIKRSLQARGEALHIATEILRQDRFEDAQRLIDQFLHKLADAEISTAVAKELLKKMRPLNRDYESSYANDLQNLAAANLSSASLLQAMEQYLSHKAKYLKDEILNAQNRIVVATANCNEKIRQAALTKEASKERIRQDLEQTKRREYQEEKEFISNHFSGDMRTQALDDVTQKEHNYFSQQFEIDVTKRLDDIETASVTAAREELTKNRADEEAIIQHNRELLEGLTITSKYEESTKRVAEQASKLAEDTPPLPEVHYPDLTSDFQYCISAIPDDNEQKAIPVNEVEIKASKAIVADFVAYGAIQVDRYTEEKIPDKDSTEFFRRRTYIDIFRQKIVEPEFSASILSLYPSDLLESASSSQSQNLVSAVPPIPSSSSLHSTSAASSSSVLTASPIVPSSSSLASTSSFTSSLSSAPSNLASQSASSTGLSSASSSLLASATPSSLPLSSNQATESEEQKELKNIEAKIAGAVETARQQAEETKAREIRIAQYELNQTLEQIEKQEAELKDNQIRIFSSLESSSKKIIFSSQQNAQQRVEQKLVRLDEQDRAAEKSYKEAQDVFKTTEEKFKVAPQFSSAETEEAKLYIRDLLSNLKEVHNIAFTEAENLRELFESELKQAEDPNSPAHAFARIIRENYDFIASQIIAKLTKIEKKYQTVLTSKPPETAKAHKIIMSYIHHYADTFQKTHEYFLQYNSYLKQKIEYERNAAIAKAQEQVAKEKRELKNKYSLQQQQLTKAKEDAAQKYKEAESRAITKAAKAAKKAEIEARYEFDKPLFELETKVHSEIQAISNQLDRKNGHANTVLELAENAIAIKTKALKIASQILQETDKGALKTLISKYFDATNALRDTIEKVRSSLRSIPENSRILNTRERITEISKMLDMANSDLVTLQNALCDFVLYKVKASNDESLNSHLFRTMHAKGSVQNYTEETSEGNDTVFTTCLTLMSDSPLVYNDELTLKRAFFASQIARSAQSIDLATTKKIGSDGKATYLRKKRVLDRSISPILSLFNSASDVSDSASLASSNSQLASSSTTLAASSASALLSLITSSSPLPTLSVKSASASNSGSLSSTGLSSALPAVSSTPITLSIRQETEKKKLQRAILDEFKEIKDESSFNQYCIGVHISAPFSVKKLLQLAGNYSDEKAESVREDLRTAISRPTNYAEFLRVCTIVNDYLPNDQKLILQSVNASSLSNSGSASAASSPIPSDTPSTDSLSARRFT